MGFFASITFLPSSSFGTWDRTKKYCCSGFAFFIVLGLILSGLVVLYTTQGLDCTWCADFNCYNYVDDFCDDGTSHSSGDRIYL